MVSGLNGTYEEKLKKLGMTTLEANRVRGDMIEMFKLMTGHWTLENRLQTLLPTCSSQNRGWKH